MLIYEYDRKTGELKAEPTIAREGPNEPGMPLIPAYATPDAPLAPVPKGCVEVFLAPDGTVPDDYRNGARQVVEDHRGTYYRIVDGSEFVLTEVGVAPAERDLTDLIPAPNSKWAGKKWVADKDKIKALQNAEIRILIARIEQEEQPAAQRKFALEGDNSLMRTVQDKIDALIAQLQD